MRERLTAAIAAGAGILTAASCGLEPGNPTPPNFGELVTAHEAPFMEGYPQITKTTPLDVGSRAVGICILFTNEESATINSGMIRVQRGDNIGVIPTLSNEDSRLVDTFKDKTEADLNNEYPHCDDFDKSEEERKKDASLL